MSTHLHKSKAPICFVCKQPGGPLVASSDGKGYKHLGNCPTVASRVGGLNDIT